MFKWKKEAEKYKDLYYRQKEAFEKFLEELEEYRHHAVGFIYSRTQVPEMMNKRIRDLEAGNQNILAEIRKYEDYALQFRDKALPKPNYTEILKAMDTKIKSQREINDRLMGELRDYWKKEAEEYEAAEAEKRRIEEIRKLLMEGLVPKTKIDELKDEVRNFYAKELDL